MKPGQVSFNSDLRLKRADHAATVLFPSDPGRLLTGLLSPKTNMDISASNNKRRFMVVVSPAITHSWRLARRDEVEVLQRRIKYR